MQSNEDCVEYEIYYSQAEKRTWREPFTNTNLFCGKYPKT
jgi:hypothetical protein